MRLSDPGGLGLAGLGSESAILGCHGSNLKAARRFAELQRRAPTRAPRVRKRAINTFALYSHYRPAASGSETWRKAAAGGAAVGARLSR